jgi:hypothetical protein
VINLFGGRENPNHKDYVPIHTLNDHKMNKLKSLKREEKQTWKRGGRGVSHL